jgi:zinc protease
MIRKFLIILFMGIITMSCTQSNNNNSVVLKSKNDPTISLRLLFKIGSQNDPQGKEGLAAITAEMLVDASTTENNYETILEKLYPMAASYSAQVDKEVTVISGRTHVDNWENYYILFREAILQPAFNEDDFSRIKSDFSNYLQNVLRYSNDEELGKQVLNQFIFKGTPYGHPEAGLVESVKNITINDVKEFYKAHYTQDNLTTGLAGCVNAEMESTLLKDMEILPEKSLAQNPTMGPNPIDGLQVLLVEKNTSSTAISLGFPIELQRNDDDFIAMWLANSWFGEHRNSSSHLYQVIRETRGMNYGDYSYIEAYPNGHARTIPPPNVGRSFQIFQIWIRPVQNQHRFFALRAAIRELQELVEKGLSQEDFDLTKKFLSKYNLHFAPTTMYRLGYKLDDHFYQLNKNFLETFADKISSLTVDQVNSAIKKHLQFKDIKIAMVTEDAESLKNDLVQNKNSPMEYDNPKPQSVLDEDKIIESYPLDIKEENVTIIKVDDIFNQ